MGDLALQVLGLGLQLQAEQALPPIRHTFTHFHLVLRVMAADVSGAATPDRGGFVPAAAFSRAALPTLMRKAFDAAHSVLAARDAARDAVEPARSGR